MDPYTVAALMAEIEMEAPLDLRALALETDEARRLMAVHFCELDSKLAEQGLAPEERLEMMAAIAAHTMVENLLLHFGRLRDADGLGAFRTWMRRHDLS